MINTYNESSLHRTLKTLYSFEEGSETEVDCDGKIYDIVDKNGNITEIQTKNLSKLLAKSTAALHNRRKVTIVHPIVLRKHIELYNGDGKLVSRRMSSSKGSIYDIWDELTGLYPVLLEKGFTLEILEITMNERRIQTAEPVQSKNCRRRFRKNWNKTDKVLDEIMFKRTFRSPRDYLSLIPKSCPSEFCAKDLEKALASDPSLPSSAARQAHLMIWVLVHMNLIEETEIKKRSRYYIKSAK